MTKARANSYQPANEVIDLAVENIQASLLAGTGFTGLQISQIKAEAYRDILQMIAKGEVENPGNLAHNVLYLETLA